VDTLRPSLRTNRTSRVPHPVLIGHAASLSQAALAQPEALDARARLPLPPRGARVTRETLAAAARAAGVDVIVLEARPALGAIPAPPRTAG